MDILGLGLIQITDWFLYLILALIGIYVYLTWTFDYFKKQGIVGPTPRVLFGTMLGLFTKGFCVIDIEDRKKYGKIYGTFAGRKPHLVVSDPDFVKHVLIKDHPNFINRQKFATSKFFDLMLSNAEGEHWKLLRTTMSPTFSTGKLKMMLSQINESGHNMVEQLGVKADADDHINLKEVFGAFTMDSIASTAFGIQLNSHKDKNDPFVAYAKKVFDFGGTTTFFLILGMCAPWIMSLSSKFDIDLIFDKKAVAFFKDITQKAMDARKETDEKRTDFLQLIINAGGKEDGDDKDETTSEDAKIKRSLTNEEVMAQCVLFFLAGYDTTSNAICLLIYELAIDPELQDKLYDEITQIVDEKDEVDYNMLNEMEFLDMCCLETLRKYTPAVRVDRVCTKTTTINGITIEKGVIVDIPIHAIHYDENIWPNPEKFDPYRFTAEEKARHDPMDHMPFGGGPRMCIATRLAMTEFKLAVVHCVKNFKVMQSDKTEKPPLKMHMFGGRPEKEIEIKMQRR